MWGVSLWPAKPRHTLPIEQLVRAKGDPPFVLPVTIDQVEAGHAFIRAGRLPWHRQCCPLEE